MRFFFPAMPVFVACLMLGGVITAQAPTASSSADDTPPPPTADEVAFARGPIAQEIRRRAARGGTERAAAIRDAVRTNLWNDANTFLVQLAAEKPKPAQLEAYATRISPSLLFRIAVDKRLATNAKPIVAEMRQAAYDASIDRDRLKSAIADLGNESDDVKLAAARVLLGGGDAAIGEMVVAAAMTDTQEPVRALLHDALSRMGSRAANAAEVLAGRGPDELRGGALRTAATLNYDAMIPALLAALHSSASTQDERSVAIGFLNHHQSELPSLGESIQHVRQSMQFAIDDASRTSLPDARDTLWALDQNGRMPIATRVTSRTVARARAADMAAYLRRMTAGTNTYNADETADAFAAALAFRIIANPNFGTADDVNSLRSVWGDSMLSSENLSGIIQRSTRDGDPAAVWAALRLIGSDPSVAGINDSAFLTLGAPQPSALVVAATNGPPR
ncbi:MAG: hypothetical protein AAFP90_07755, partial [Planctomycetota bacterium]